jgi:hypothetical protein
VSGPVLALRVQAAAPEAIATVAQLPPVQRCTTCAEDSWAHPVRAARHNTAYRYPLLLLLLPLLQRLIKKLLLLLLLLLLLIVV